MDIKTEYVNANIDEEIFTDQPEGFEKNSEQANPLVCKLDKNLYGFKQSGRNWYLTIKSFLGSFCFVPSIHDDCLVKKGRRGYEGSDLFLCR